MAQSPDKSHHQSITSNSVHPMARIPKSKCLLIIRPNGKDANRRYSDNFKTDEPIKTYWKISSPQDLDVILAHIEEISHRWGISFELFTTEGF